MSRPGPDPDNLDALADELSEIITALETTPDNVGLLRKQIDILRQLDMLPEVLDTILRLSSLVMVEEDVWSVFFDESLSTPMSLDTLVQVFEHFDTAEKDHHSIKLLARHAKFVLECVSPSTGAIDEDIFSFLSPDTVRGILTGLYAQSAGDLAFSHQVWDIWRDWELTQVLITDDKAAQMDRIHAMFLQRLATPHIDSDSTSSAYSTFCTAHAPEHYEDRMVTATSTSQKAKAKLSGERRHGKTREDFELQISAATDVMSQIPTLVTYMDWEMDPKAKASGSQGPVTDPALIRSVTERTVAAYALAADQSPLETQVLLKDGEASIWARYITWLQSSHKDKTAMDIALRATRACPQSPVLWGLLLHEMERREYSADDLSAAFDRAQNLGAMFVEGSTSFVEVFVTRVAQLHRMSTATAGYGDYVQIFETAERGFALVERLNKTGDPTLKLEKHLLDWAETCAPTQLDNVLTLIEKPLRARSSSYQLTLLKAGLECRRADTAAAREIYNNAIQRSDLDWPEAVYEAFLQFEDIHGSVDSIMQTRSKVAKETQRLARRRERQQEQSLAVQVAQEATVAPAASQQPEAPAATVAAGKNDSAESEAKRDREHTTVLISGLAKGTSQALVESFFESCGLIRETAMLVDESRTSDAALLEFKAVESVAPALAKDRRKLDGQEISVTMLWRSTLFITNFPRELDDVAIRGLFSNYGHILQSRWPSRKYADNRRFCYLTMDSPAAAEGALVLDGYRSDPDSRFGLTVRISDPSVKARRSDEKDAVLFVGGLNAKTTEQDVKDLFKDTVSIKSLKLGWDSVKAVCKGFAFVTLSSDADAKEGLKLHGTQYKGRKLKVEQSDPNFANKKATSDAEMRDKRSRTVRLDDIPAGMQEALLQQALEKLVPVRRLELFSKTNHAQAELENQADVGKLLLRSEPFVVDGTTIPISEHTRRQPVPPAAEQKKLQAVQADALSFAPRAARRSGNTLGKGRHGTTNVGASPLPSNASGNAQDAFRAVVDAKNKQREGNLESTRSKRSSDQAGTIDETVGEVQGSKKPRTS